MVRANTCLAQSVRIYVTELCENSIAHLKGKHGHLFIGRLTRTNLYVQPLLEQFVKAQHYFV